MWSISSQPTTHWQSLSDEDAQLWQQLAQRHYRAIVQLRQQAASWGDQVVELKTQLSEIRALHHLIQARQQPPQPVNGSPAMSAGELPPVINESMNW